MFILTTSRMCSDVIASHVQRTSIQCLTGLALAADGATKRTLAARFAAISDVAGAPVVALKIWILTERRQCCVNCNRRHNGIVMISNM